MLDGRRNLIMKLCVVFLWAQWSWLPSGQALYHEGSTTFTLSKAQLHRANNSYFGFSVTYEAIHKRLIVGAPRGSDVGQVFSCDIDSRNCINIPIPITRYDQDHFRHDYWLGATLKSDPKYFYTCAPRAYSSYDGSKGFESGGSKGRCIKIANINKNYSNVTDVEDIGDRRYDDVTKYGQAVDTFGWSIDIGAKESFLIGGPAMFTGRVKAKYGYGSQVQSLTGVKSGIRFNFGYSVAISNFIDPMRENINYAIGSPYGAIGSGKVLVYNIDAAKPENIRIAYKLERYSHGVGSMFGAVLCAAHMSGLNQPAALLVGAPAHALENKHDVGAVFVYFMETQIRVIEGEHSGGFFGLAITNVGDLNSDNRDEVAIAAPYEVDGRGAVYVYCGASIVGEDATIAYLQRLEPRPGHHVRGFGLALAPLLDYDQNGCNELAIGAPYSNSVSLLRCFATVKLQLYAVFPDMKSRNTSYFKFDACVLVTYPDKPEHIIGSVNVALSIFHPHAYLANSMDSNYTVSLEDRNQTAKCRKVKVSTPKGNYELPIEWKMTAVQMDSPLKDAVFNPSRVLVSERSQLSAGSTVRAAECNGTCEPKLSLKIHTYMRNSLSTPYLIGSSVFEAFFIEVLNSGDKAYDSCVRVYIKGASILAGSVTECTRAEGSYICKPPGSLGNEPWRPSDLQMSMSELTNKIKEIVIFADLYPHCDATNKTEYNKTIYLKSDSNNVTIKGKTIPDAVINITKADVNSLGKHIEHVYTITNDGVTNWKDIEYSITFVKSPYISKSVVSTFIDYVDYLTPCNNHPIQETPDRVIVTCVIKELDTNDKMNIIVPIYLPPEGLGKLRKNENKTVDTFISLNLDGVIVKERVRSTLVLMVVVVPPYIIVAAVFLGLLLVGILGWTLYECGFLRRKIKKDLVNLKKDVHRQSMRRSMLAELRQRQADMEHRNENEATCTIESIENVNPFDRNKNTDALVNNSSLMGVNSNTCLLNKHKN